MKCFNIVVVGIIGLALGNISVLSRKIDSFTPNCVEELWELKHQYDSCGPDNFQMSQILDVIIEYRGHTINGTHFSSSINDYCRSLKSAASCSTEKATKISLACQDTPKGQFFLNLMRIISRLGNNLCTEPIIYEIASDKGFSCLDANELIDCVLQRRLSKESTEQSLEGRNVCETARRLQTCSDAKFDECVNDGIIKKYVDQLVIGLVQDFSCE